MEHRDHLLLVSNVIKNIKYSLHRMAPRDRNDRILPLLFSRRVEEKDGKLRIGKLVIFVIVSLFFCRRGSKSNRPG